MSTTDILLWVVLPYISLAIFVVGHYWRYKYDKFGWTTRSSQLYERRLLRWGSPLFHFGILFVAARARRRAGDSEVLDDGGGHLRDAYHVVAVVTGAIAGFCTLAGLAILIYRRRTVGPVFSATTKNDKFMYVVLTATILFGLSNTVLGNMLGHEGADYRDTVSPWFRSIFYFQPQPELMTEAGLGYQLHALSALPAVRHLAVHPARARLQRTAGLPDPALHRLPQPGRAARQPAAARGWERVGSAGTDRPPETGTFGPGQRRRPAPDSSGDCP